MSSPPRLGVNIDHVATIRNARGSHHPDPTAAAFLAAEAGADGITAHLREDRRHIRDEDIARLMHEVPLPLNLEMAATAEMLAIALTHRPHAVCLVPERRAERTTEGGLDAVGQEDQLRTFVARLSDAGIRVSLFIAPDPCQIEAAVRLRTPVIELHTGHYAHLHDKAADAGNGGADVIRKELGALTRAARDAAAAGLEVHAGHGLTFANVAPIAKLPEVAELNIGHFLIGEAIFSGLIPAVGEMKRRILAARANGE